MKFAINRWLVLITLTALTACGKADYQDTQGNSGQFADLHGKWLVINYWAVWCKPCIEEIPELNHFAQQHAASTVVFAVNFDGETGDTLIAQSDKLDIQFPVLIADPAAQLGYPRPQVLPTTLIFNPQGKLHRTLLGPQTLESLQQAME